MQRSVWLSSCLLVASVAGAEDARFFDAKPGHPWNRLWAALHTESPDRFGEGPEAYEARVLEGDTYRRALRALDEFLATPAAKDIKTPLQRAILQKELWEMFDAVADATAGHQTERQEIARRCAAIIRRVALSEAEIAALPDNLATTARSGQFPAAWDEAHRENAFLPADLLDANGPWVMLSSVSSDDPQPAAIQHAKATQGRAVFYVLVRLPAGRQATRAYLKQLAEFPQPYVINDEYRRLPYAYSAMTFNPELPQFPVATQVALVRRMVLISSRGEPVVSPLTESVQLRVYAKDPRTVELGASGNQDFYEAHLVPEELIEGAGGLRVAATFASAPASSLTFAKRSFTVLAPHLSCNNCHGRAGVRSLNTYTHWGMQLPGSPWFERSEVSSQDWATLHWKKRDYTWGLLSALLGSR